MSVHRTPSVCLQRDCGTEVWDILVTICENSSDRLAPQWHSDDGLWQ